MKALIIDTFVVRGRQGFNQYNILNTINTDIGISDHFRRFFKKYSAKNFTYRFRLMSITISSNISNIGKEILLSCTGLNDCKHSNRYGDNVLAIIHLESISNWEQIGKTSCWVNINLVGSQDAKEAGNIAFGFFTRSALDISKFKVELRNDKREFLVFSSEGKKVPQINFVTDAVTF